LGITLRLLVDSDEPLRLTGTRSGAAAQAAA
jgi:hypothetical protein